MHLLRWIWHSDRRSARYDRRSSSVQRALDSTTWGLHPARSKGFTLIEVMIVLALIAILSSIAMPSLRGFAASTRLKSTARAIQDILNFARDMAITERAAYLVVFDLSSNRYWLASNETFNPADPSTPVTANPSRIQSALPSAANQAATVLQSSIPSRTNAVLGIAQKPGHDVRLARMITNHNFQTVQMDTGVDYIYFSPTGSSEDTVLYIQDQRGQTMSIVVENATGRIRLQKINSRQLDALGLDNEVSE